MKISKVEFQNFRNFRDHCELTFPTDGSVTVIYGPNGVGKTTLHQWPGRIRVSFKTVQGSVSWDTCYTPCGMCPAFNYTSITYPC